MFCFRKIARIEGGMRLGSLPVAILVSVLAALGGTSAQAANISSTQTGNWDVGTTWVGGVPPVAGDNATIASTHTVTVTADAAAATVTLAANGSGTNGITINSGITLAVSGAITMTAPTVGTSTIDVGAGTLTAASIAIPGSATAGLYCTVTVSTGTITTTGSITFSGTAAQARITSTGASTVNVAGNFGSGGTLTTSSTGTVNFNGGAAQTVGTYTTYNNVTINNTSGGVTLTGTTTFGGTLTVTTGTLTVGAFTLTVTGATSVSGTLSITSTTGTKTFTGDVTINNGGTWDNTSAGEAVSVGGNFQNDGTFSAGTGVYTFTGATKTISGANAVSIPSLTVTGTVANNGTLTVGTALSGSGGLTQGTGFTLNIGGTAGITTLTATANPNTVNYNGSANQTINATTYHNLTVTSTGGTVTCGGVTVNNDFTVVSGTASLGASTVTGATSISGTLDLSPGGPKTFVGAVTINGGGVWSNTTRDCTFQGGLTNNAATFTAGTGTYTFNTNSQAIGGSSAISLNRITVTGVTLTNNSTALSVVTSLSGTGGLTQAASSTLNIAGSSGITTLTATAVPNTVNYNGSANQTINATTYHKLTVTSTGGTVTCGSVTVNNDFTVVSGTASLGTSTVTGATSISGTLSLSPAGTKTFVGAVTINSGGVWSGTSRDAVFRGGLTHNGTTFSSGTGVYTFDTNAQAVGGTTALTIDNVTVTGVTLTNNSTSFTVSTALSGTGGLTQGASATLNISGTSGITTLTATANPNTVNYSGAAQTVRAITYHHLTLSGSGAKTMPGSTLTLNGDFTMSGTATATALAAVNTAGNFTVGGTNTFTTGSFTHDLKGNFSNSGTFTATGSTITLTGTSDQSVGGTTTTTFNNLTVSKSTGAVTVSTSFNVSGTLTFTSGNISTGGNAVAITSTGSVSRTSGQVIGNFQKNVATGSDISRTYEIGDAGNYVPVTVVFASVSVAGNLTASTTAGDHANIATSDIIPTKSVNRYWTVSKDANLAFTTYSATFTFVSGDVDAGATTSDFAVRRYSGGTWSFTTIGTRTATSTQITGEAGTGDFQVGNSLSVAVSNSVFAFGAQPLNTWLAAQSSVITNDGTETEAIVAKISTLTEGSNTWSLSAVSNGADQVRAQWSTTSATGPWTDISAYDANFTLNSSLAASGTVTLYVRIQTPTSTTSYGQYSSTLTVTAQ